MSAQQPHLGRRSAALLLTGFLGVVLVSYLIRNQDDEPDRTYFGAARSASHDGDLAHDVDVAEDVVSDDSTAPVAAASYAQMRRRETGPTSRCQPSVEQMPSEADFQRCITCHDPHLAVPKPSEQDKLQSLAMRASRRAFNGAPPVIPHAVERTDDAACYACHGQGARIGDRVANRMSHGLLVNCLQCHAEPPPKPFHNVDIEVANAFTGLAAPVSGPRAFAGAPPGIPHSTWMRENCLSCHGGAVGWAGLEVTHRWRTNCLQCHATSPDLEQGVVVGDSALPPAVVAQRP